MNDLVLSFNTLTVDSNFLHDKMSDDYPEVFTWVNILINTSVIHEETHGSGVEAVTDISSDKHHL